MLLALNGEKSEDVQGTKRSSAQQRGEGYQLQRVRELNYLHSFHGCSTSSNSGVSLESIKFVETELNTRVIVEEQDGFMNLFSESYDGGNDYDSNSKD